MDRSEFTELINERTPIVWRDDYLAQLCSGRSVLDVGCVDHTALTAERLGDGWLHQRLAGVAKSITGTDYLVEDVEVLRRKGFNIVQADAEDFELGRTFDVIVAGDIIEHLNNVGGFLNSLKRHMRSDSTLVLTTVNPFDVEQMMQVVLNGRVAVHPDHTLWMDPGVMHHMVERAGLQVVDFTWTRTRYRPVSGPGLFSQVMRGISSVVMRYRPLTRPSFAVVCRLLAGGSSD